VACKRGNALPVTPLPDRDDAAEVIHPAKISWAQQLQMDASSGPSNTVSGEAEPVLAERREAGLLQGNYLQR